MLVRLVAQHSDGQVDILQEGAFKLVLHSPAASLRRIAAGTAEWPQRALDSRLVHGRLDAPIDFGRTTGMGAHLRDGRNLLRRIVREATEEQWTVGILDRPVASVLDRFDPKEIRWLPEMTGGYAADPFGVERGGELTILAELFPFAEPRGRIGRLYEDGRTETLIDGSCHLSYPQIITHAGQIWCLPEASTSRELRLYCADPFPTRWQPDRLLLENFPAVDATVFEHDGRWWMLTANHDDQDETRLYVFHAPDLFGPWSPHAMNPVRSDLRSARPAGPPFQHEGKLYRPAQDCSRTYGGAIAINRIDVLTPDRFEERIVKCLEPDPNGPYPDGLHTLVGVGQRTLVDGKREFRSVKRLLQRLRSGLG
ncbi:MAG: hypothetical protein U1E45_23565 [Geminicoccaceae bacterium]